MERLRMGNTPFFTMTKKRKRTVLTFQSKIEIVERLEKGETATVLAEEFGIGKSTISQLKKNKDNLLHFVSTMGSENGKKKRKTMKCAKNSMLEDALYAWFSHMRSLGEPVSGPLLCEKALEMNRKLNGNPDFKASSGWLARFKSRHGIHHLGIHQEKLSVDPSAAQCLKQEFANFKTEEDSDPESIYNTVVVPGPSHSEAYNALEIALQWLEDQKESDVVQLLFLKSLRDLAAQKIASSLKSK
ncbi:PREDICTED: jerky protein homolog-like isoform X1 [Gekko japonicus]|uniref:Jerky protein homolog-like isoform X1 n=1 Tax=Gekko japonicus TaxID=146911 RepID=A0ABM1KSE8_GEKJA|nr:PREDICTED: jerky protein homolog-like isoform X1 [Gekko japonicus]